MTYDWSNVFTVIYSCLNQMNGFYLSSFFSFFVGFFSFIHDCSLYYCLDIWLSVEKAPFLSIWIIIETCFFFCIQWNYRFMSNGHYGSPLWFLHFDTGEKIWQANNNNTTNRMANRRCASRLQGSNMSLHFPKSIKIECDSWSLPRSTCPSYP